MVVDGGYFGRGVQDVPPIQGMCGFDTSNVGSMAAKRNPSWMDKIYGRSEDGGQAITV